MMTTRNISPDLHKILESLSSHSQRWSDVSLLLSPTLFQFLDNLCRSFSILQKMHIEMISDPAEFLDGLPLMYIFSESRCCLVLLFLLGFCSMSDSSPIVQSLPQTRPDIEGTVRP